jgi:hypothetical protein
MVLQTVRLSHGENFLRQEAQHNFNRIGHAACEECEWKQPDSQGISLVDGVDMMSSRDNLSKRDTKLLHRAQAGWL